MNKIDIYGNKKSIGKSIVSIPQLSAESRLNSWDVHPRRFWPEIWSTNFHPFSIPIDSWAIGHFGGVSESLQICWKSQPISLSAEKSIRNWNRLNYGQNRLIINNSHLILLFRQLLVFLPIFLLFTRELLLSRSEFSAINQNRLLVSK